MASQDKYRILLVDDNEHAAETCIDVLRKHLSLGEAVDSVKGSKKRESEDGNIFLYHYQPAVGKNLKDDILSLIETENINVLWFDKGYYETIEENGRILTKGEIAKHKIGDAVELLLEILATCSKRAFNQIAVYSFNPGLEEKVLKAAEKKIKAAWQENKKDVWFLEPEKTANRCIFGQFPRGRFGSISTTSSKITESSVF